MVFAAIEQIDKFIENVHLNFKENYLLNFNCSPFSEINYFLIPIKPVFCFVV